MPTFATVTFAQSQPGSKQPYVVGVSQEEFPVDFQATLNLALKLESSVSGAAYATTPITWDDPPPAGTQVHRESDMLVTISETNNNQGSVALEYSFRIHVAYNGQNYESPDPVLINKADTGFTK